MEEKAQSISEKEKNIMNSMEAENLFKTFLNNEKIPYYYIDQSINKYSYELYKKEISRPDFVIHTEKGVFYIDVKHRKEFIDYNNNRNERFYLNQDEIDRLYKFQILLGSDVWIAFINVEKEGKIFFFASISDIYNYFLNIKSIIEKEHKEHQNEFGECYIYIPNNFLYSSLSYNIGFFKEYENISYKDEAILHIDRAIAIKKSQNNKNKY